MHDPMQNSHSDMCLHRWLTKVDRHWLTSYHSHAGEDMHDLQLSAVLHDLAAEAGRGLQIGAANLQLDISEWSEGQSHSQTLTFLGTESAKVGVLLLCFATQAFNNCEWCCFNVG